MAKQDYRPEPKPCPDCSRLERKLDAFVTFLCAPLPKCQSCGLLATRLTTVVHPIMGRSEHLCCEICIPTQGKIAGAVLEHAPIGDVDRAKEVNAIISGARRDMSNGS